MNNSNKNTAIIIQEPQTPQCQYFVMRKKRLCRMTVRPGRQYCGEHEPDPKTEDGQNDARIPCPNDPKHTCYISKLEKHLSICNARQVPLPPYIEMNVNAPVEEEPPIQISLSQVPKDRMLLLIDKINKLYDEYIKDNIETFEDQDIHEAVRADFEESNRTESSRRHLRQVSALLRLAERERLVRPDTCYVELGAGKGQLSYYLWRAWGAGGGRVVLVDRASLRHKRDNKLRPAQGGDGDEDGQLSYYLWRAWGAGGGRVVLVDRASLRHKRDNKLRPAQGGDGDGHEGGAGAGAGGAVCRVRASLEHLVLSRVEAARGAARVVGVAKHLCGAATDYALRCVVRCGGAGCVVATCCHHRCRRAHLLGAQHLQEMGISAEEFEILLRMVSWATCGDGRSRQRRAAEDGTKQDLNEEIEDKRKLNEDDDKTDVTGRLELSVEQRAEVGRRGKALLDYCRVLSLRRAGYAARLCRLVPASVSPENTCIVARLRGGGRPDADHV